jgi:hypothetical protein
MSSLLGAPETPAPLAWTPPRCPHGHRLGPYRVVHGWEPCGCIGVDPARGRGHHWTRCLACAEEDRKVVYYEPRCQRAEYRRAVVVTPAGPGAWVELAA